MSQLQVGDHVRVNANGEYQRVYTFGHRDEDLSSEFLQFLPSKLELSPSHMVLVERKAGDSSGIALSLSGRNYAMMPASLVGVGDILVRVVNSDEERMYSREAVTAIRKVVRKGAFAPFTPSGTIVVNGVIASSYVSLQENSHVLSIQGIPTTFSIQWLSHNFLTIHRLWCHWLGLKDPMLGNAGKSSIAMFGMQLAQKTILNPKVSALFRLTQFIVLLGAICLLSVIETMLINPVISGLLFMLACFSRRLYSGARKMCM